MVVFLILDLVFCAGRLEFLSQKRERGRKDKKKDEKNQKKEEFLPPARRRSRDGSPATAPEPAAHRKRRWRRRTEF